MTYAKSLSEALPGARFRVWHLWLLALFVAVAIVNIQDQGRTEPVLVVLASAGYVLYGLLGWGGWLVARRFRSRLGPTTALILYLASMAALFVVATIDYLLIEHAYVVGGLDLARLPGVGRFLVRW